MEKNFVITDLKWKGYAQFYIALFFEDDTVTICKSAFDFSKPISETFIQKLVEMACEHYKEQNLIVTHVQFVNEEAYNKFIELHEENIETVITWNKDSIYINGKEYK